MSIDREELTKIIESENGINWWKPDLFAQKTLPLLPKELKIISPPPAHDDNYNCFVYIFGLQIGFSIKILSVKLHMAVL